MHIPWRGSLTQPHPPSCWCWAEGSGLDRSSPKTKTQSKHFKEPRSDFRIRTETHVYLLQPSFKLHYGWKLPGLLLFDDLRKEIGRGSVSQWLLIPSSMSFFWSILLYLKTSLTLPSLQSCSPKPKGTVPAHSRSSSYRHILGMLMVRTKVGSR